MSLVVFDLDDVLQFGEVVPPGAAAVVERARDAGHTVRFLTNDGINSRASRSRSLRAGGIDAPPDHVYTTSRLAARYVRERNLGPILALCGEPALDEFDGIERTVEGAGAVVIGDWFPFYDYGVLKHAFTALEAGAPLIAMHKKPWWPSPAGRMIDLGFWVAGLEYAAGTKATLVGKPAAFAYEAVMRDTGAGPGTSVMIADQDEPDLRGARAAGLRTIHLLNGRSDSAPSPDADAIATDYDELGEAIARIVG